MGSDAQLGQPHSLPDADDHLERALSAYEAALVGAPPGRRRLADEPSPGDLQQLRYEVIRRSSVVPSSEWPRPPCRHCSGERVLHLPRASANSAERELVSTPCPPCWGTGLTLNLAYRRRLERSRASEP